MAYSTFSGIQSLLSDVTIARLTDDTAGIEVNTQIVNEAISSGDELIDGYLRNRYTLPLSNVPKLITFISVKLAIYFLFQRRFSEELPESVVDDYKNQIKILEQIQKGFISLGVEEKSTETSQKGFNRSNKTSSDRLFNKDFINQFTM